MFLIDRSGSGNGVPLSQEAAKLAKIAEYLRRGIEMVYAIRQFYFDYNPSKGDEICGACAIGTILVGLLGRNISGPRSKDPVLKVNELLPGLAFKCPSADMNRVMPLYSCDDDEGFKIGELAEHLFEDHTWTRAAIADWIEAEVLKLDAEIKQGLLKVMV